MKMDSIIVLESIQNLKSNIIIMRTDIGKNILILYNKLFRIKNSS